MCFDFIIRLVTTKVVEDHEDSFLKWIDSSLNALDDVDVGASDVSTSLNVSRGHVEQALCHAMSIAQIVQHVDGENIKHCCKQVSRSVRVHVCYHGRVLSRLKNRVISHGVVTTSGLGQLGHASLGMREN